MALFSTFAMQLNPEITGYYCFFSISPQYLQPARRILLATIAGCNCRGYQGSEVPTGARLGKGCRISERGAGSNACAGMI